ncbi:MAG: hypothetical protein N3G22_01590, partial [Candidatus Micrarchaeota archaeon]|nr:hypothetical protein [Candidatus Micrarchaeota archaeon]
MRQGIRHNPHEVAKQIAAASRQNPTRSFIRAQTARAPLQEEKKPKKEETPLEPSGEKASGWINSIRERFGKLVQASLVSLTLFLVNPAIDAAARLLSQIKGKPTIAANAGAAQDEKKPPVRYENGVKIIGEKLFDFGFDYENKVVYIDYQGSRYTTKIKGEKGRTNMLLLELMLGTPLKQKIYHEVEGLAKNLYLVFESGIVELSFKTKVEIIGVYIAGASDDSKIFLHDGAIYVSPNGSIVATTPTTLLMITPKEVVSSTYKRLFGLDIKLEKPYIIKGKDDDYAEL